MSELPRGWVEASVNEVGSTTEQAVLTGPFGASLGKADFKSCGVPVFTIGCLGSGYIIEEKLRFISEQKAAKLSAYRLREGDLMFSRMATVGRVGFVPPQLAGSIFNYHLMRLRLCGAVIEPRFFYHYIKGSERAALYLEDQNRGATRDGINTKLLEQLPISLPPLAEQKRIVARLDALNAKSARARTELARIDTLVSRYKQAVLSKAFSGELTSAVAAAASGATVDTASQVTPLWSVPDTWSWHRTDQVGRVGLGRQRSPKNHEGPQMRPYLRSANITWQGVDTSDVKEMNFDDADFRRFRLEVGDVLLNEGSGSAKEVGKPAIWRGEIADCCYQNTLLRVQPHRCSSEYVYYYFLLTARAGRFVSNIQGVNIQHIGREGLASYPFPLASEPEQHEIVRRIEAAFARIDRLAAEAKRALELVGRLDEAILAKAFRGELVPQDENDEPADRLLARIHAERAAAPKARRGRRAKA